MKLKTKYPCENCAEGTYMTVEQEWWCDKHLMYACQMERNRLCEKFERDGEQADGGRQAVLDMVTASNEKMNRDREEAINIIKSECYVFNPLNFDRSTKVNTALDMAIEALEQEPMENFESTKDHILKLAGDYKCWDNRLTHDEALELCHMLEQEPCEDAVSRQAVLDMASVIETDDYSGNEILKVVDVDDIKALPSVTPAPKKGKWIDTDVTLLNRQGHLVHEVICSECNGISYFRKMGDKYIGANLCPNCGARIVKEDKL